MAECDDGGPMEGVTHGNQASDSQLGGTTGNILKKITGHVGKIAGSVQAINQLLEEPNHDEDHKAPQFAADRPSPQDKSESLEQENRRLKKRVESLQEMLQSESRKTQDLHKMIIKAAGHTTGGPNDPKIQAGFKKLRDEIYQLVKKHLNVDTKQLPEKASGDASELIFRAKIATRLYEYFFDEQSCVFGIEPKLEEGLANFEKEILHAAVEPDEVFEWRARTIQICQGLKKAGKHDRVGEARRQIWDDVKDLCYDQEDGTAPAVKDLQAVCESALDLAILLRSTKTEFKWEQGPQAAISTSKSEEDVEIVGTLGPDKGEDYKVDQVVFGGLVRGDAKTGRFKDGQVRLLTSSVLIAEKESPEYDSSD